MSKRLTITATLVLDPLSWPEGDTDAQNWMLNSIVLGDDLRVFSPEIGDEVGVLLVQTATLNKEGITGDD